MIDVFLLQNMLQNFGPAMRGRVGGSVGVTGTMGSIGRYVLRAAFGAFVLTVSGGLALA
jgi:hypothetical protein